MIVNDRECAEDLVESATRFKQLVQLWELATTRPEGGFGVLLETNTGSFVKALSRLLEGRSMRWERMRDGRQQGYPIDLGYEARFGFLVELAGSHQSAAVAGMADRLSA